MVEGRRGEVDALLVEIPHGPLQARHGPGAEGAADPLRTARGPGAVEHEGPGRLLGERCRRVLRDGVFVGQVAVFDAVGHQPGLAVGRKAGQLFGHVGQVLGGNGDPRLAVVDDITRFFIRQVAVDRGEVEPRTKRSPDHLEITQVVLHEDRDVIFGPQAPVP